MIRWIARWSRSSEIRALAETLLTLTIENKLHLVPVFSRRGKYFFSFRGSSFRRASFHLPYHRLFTTCNSSSTRRDGIALTTATLTSLSPCAGRATRLFLHPRTQLCINRGSYSGRSSYLYHICSCLTLDQVKLCRKILSK